MREFLDDEVGVGLGRGNDTELGGLKKQRQREREKKGDFRNRNDKIDDRFVL